MSFEMLPSAESTGLETLGRFSILASKSFFIFLADVQFLSLAFSYSTCLTWVGRIHEDFTCVQASLPLSLSTLPNKIAHLLYVNRILLGQLCNLSSEQTKLCLVFP